jgi:hypothetical protein
MGAYKNGLESQDIGSTEFFLGILQLLNSCNS